MMDLISVIVPIYKVEQYLDKCIESIVNQTYENLEIILVDDGSPDRCPEICDEWALRDKRIKVIHQQNSGGGQARNVALDIAKGNFIGFVDSDDYIHPQMYENLIKFMRDDIDIVECDFIEVYDEKGLFSHKNSGIKTIEMVTDKALQKNIEDTLFRQIIWNKLYRREVVEEIYFPVGTKIDDEFWTYRVIGNARKLLHCNIAMYAYRQQPESIMHKKFSIERLQALDAKCDRVNYLIERYPLLVPAAKCNLFFTCLFLGQMSLIYLDKRECKNAFAKIEKVRKIYPMVGKEVKGLPLKSKVWIYLSKFSLRKVCAFRNWLRRGL